MMHKSTQFKKQPKASQFVKGMTLNQYLASYPAFLPSDREEQANQKQQNLEETSHYGLRKRIQSKGGQYKIQEVDQESIEDSIEYKQSGKTGTTPFFEELDIAKERNWEDLLTQQNTKNKVNRISVNSRENTKNHSEEKSSVRAKQMSMSPVKRKNQDTSAKGSMTLYGAKFRQATKKETNKMAEVLTFYGKLSLEKQPQKTKPKNSQKGGDLKQSFKKKSQVQLNLLTPEIRIKSNYSCGTNYREMVVVGVKDKLNLRKQRHIE